MVHMVHDGVTSRWQEPARGAGLPSNRHRAQDLFLAGKGSWDDRQVQIDKPYFVNLWLPIMALADLDELIAEVDRTCPTVDWVERLRVAGELAAKLRALGDDLVTEFVEH